MDIGVAIVPRMCVRWEIEQGLLVEVKVRQLRMPRDLYLLYRRREPLSHSAKAMLELLKPGSSPAAAATSDEKT
jgi:DNA-binding transcriptional LysR family regulator